jgi:STE24 endopeptidase
MRQFLAGAVLVLLTLVTAASSALAQGGPAPAPTSTVEVGTLPPIADAAAKPLDVNRAVNLYLSSIKGPAREKSDAYFEGGYVLLLVDMLYAVAAAALLLFTRFSAGMRNLAQRITRLRWLQAPLYAVQYIVAMAVLTFPLVVYEGFFREHAYGLSNQTFLAWFGEFGISFGLQLVIGTLAATIGYAAIRRTGRAWWLWGSALAVIFFTIGMVISPVFIAPLFNTYKSLPESTLRENILSVARANQIPADDVYLFDASRQSKRISANVSGFLGTTRISLNDNLLNRSSERETLAVMGHEMGHYVLDHSVRLLIFLALIVLVGFWFANWAFGALTSLFGGVWNVRDIEDPAGLPVLAAIAAVYLFLTVPIQNTMIRSTEAQADIFGLNAVRQPDGFATATLKLSEYRKLDPSPWEEFVFYDHPSGRSRITMAMQWKAEHMNDPDIKKGPVSPQ